MKIFFRISMVVMSVLFFLPSAKAADSSWYVGLKAGQMMVDLDGLDDATNGGVLVGYSFGDFAIEAEYTTTLSEGDVTILGVPGEWDINTFAVYGVYRSSGNIYFKGKVGFLNEDVSINVNAFGTPISAAGSDSSASLGVGVGWRIPDSNSLELEYTIVEEDIDFLSLGYNYHF